MKTEQIFPALGGFTTGLFIGVILFTLILLPHYQRAVNHAHWADEVIKECEEYYTDFDDVIAEGDNYCNYTLNK